MLFSSWSEGRYRSPANPSDELCQDIGDCVLHLVDGVYLGAEYSPEQMGKAAYPVPAYKDKQCLGAGCQLDAA